MGSVCQTSEKPKSFCVANIRKTCLILQTSDFFKKNVKYLISSVRLIDVFLAELKTATAVTAQKCELADRGYGMTLYGIRSRRH